MEIESFSPYARTMGFETGRDAAGRLTLSLPYSDEAMGRPGFVHGGALAGLLETIAFVTLAERFDADDRPRIKPVNVTVSFLRGATEQTTHARASVERLGKRVAYVEAVAWQDDPEKPVAIAQLNLLLDRS